MKNKNIIVSLIATMLLFGASACDSSNNSSASSATSITSETVSSSESIVKFRSLDEICDFLDKKGYIDISTKNEMRAELIGAVKGYSFTGCEIYQYDKECPKNLTIYGISVPYTARNGKYGLYINGLYKGDKERFANDFSSMKTD